MLYTKCNSWKLRFYLVKECEVLIADSLLEEWKVGPQYTQAILVREGILAPPTEV